MAGPRPHGFFVQTGGLMYDDGKCYQVVTTDKEGNAHLGANEKPTLDIVLPIVTEEEIQDKSKANSLSKVIVVMQTSWFVFQCIARHAQGLVVTQLELVTLAFVTLNIITYFLWWSKPLNAEYPVYFTKDGTQSTGPMRRPSVDSWVAERYLGLWISWPLFKGWLSGSELKDMWQWIREDPEKRSLGMTVWKKLIKGPFLFVFDPLLNIMSDEGVKNSTSVRPYSAGHLNDGESFTMLYACSFIGVLFGGIHLIHWDFPFTTRAEQVLWRASSLTITIEPILMSIFFVLAHLRNQGYVGLICRFIDIALGLAGFIFVLLGTFLYGIARIVLIVQPLIALRDLPPSAYQNVQWSIYLPRIQ
ncbi:hypothetical protein AX16_002755 [Volvariella volvacea WC 439]|nr:hypothetical protein AX16_002755 [Volvariella volvacea WC 439]